jgi:phosphoenolpyruvate---glycerone phosphotransferase subunit DhaL
MPGVSTAASDVGAHVVVSWMDRLATDVRADAQRLTQLDAAIGDGDHGINMTRGLDAVVAALAAQEGDVPPGRLLIVAGKTMVSTVGGASGPLWGTFLRTTGRTLGDEPAPGGAALAAALAAGVKAVQDLGAAAPGDKTMVDALLPAVEALREELAGGASLADAAARAATVAAQAARATIPLQARKGRASYLGERSVGHEDPGAASTVLVMSALARAVA